MARPQPTLIDTGREQDSLIDIVQADNLYVLLYNGRPVGLRRRHISINGTYIKYQKTSYNNRQVAENACRRYNKIFGGTGFTYQAIGEQQ
jgi:hypothetical protein